MAKQKPNQLNQNTPTPKSRWVTIIITLLILTFFAYLFAGITSLFSYTDEPAFGNVALIKIHGIITTQEDGFSLDDQATSDEIIKLIKKAEENPEVKAILFEINSPGGSAVASKEIADEIARVSTNQNKTTIAVIREIGTSGAYWIASSTDLIIASPLSITGSIGVISSYLEFNKLFDKYGINYRRLVAGKYKDIASPFRNLTEEEQKILQTQLDSVHDYFIKEIAKNRNMSVDDVKKVADGLFYLGEEAQKLGLVDLLGDKETAKELLKESLALEDIKIVEYKKPKGFIDALFESFSKQSFSVGEGIGSSLVNSENKKSLIST
ncbi:signal peptide peptidase SppA [Candidatus Woesearchaeota archaeon]|nr:signal peptide peptidase SppA [Candidatus Woesearchaeota archaeon]